MTIIELELFPSSKSKTAKSVVLNEDHPKSPGDFGSDAMNDYLLGSRKLKPFPVSMSLIARFFYAFFLIPTYLFFFSNFSYISGVTILGTPTEIYNFGTQYWLIIVPIILMGITVSTVYLPVFSALRVGSSYEVCFISMKKK